MNLLLSPKAETLKARSQFAWEQQLAENPQLSALYYGPDGETVKEAWIFGFTKGIEIALTDVQEVMAAAR